MNFWVDKAVILITIRGKVSVLVQHCVVLYEQDRECRAPEVNEALQETVDEQCYFNVFYTLKLKLN